MHIAPDVPSFDESDTSTASPVASGGFERLQVQMATSLLSTVLLGEQSQMSPSSLYPLITL